jgi:hypothetical protein
MQRCNAPVARPSLRVFTTAKGSRRRWLSSVEVLKEQTELSPEPSVDVIRNIKYYSALPVPRKALFTDPSISPSLRQGAFLKRTRARESASVSAAKRIAKSKGKDAGRPTKSASSDPQAKDIVLNNLSATLESHRASNRASIIRWCVSGPPINDHDVKAFVAQQASEISLAGGSEATTLQSTDQHESTTPAPLSSLGGSAWTQEGSKVRGQERLPRKRSSTKVRSSLDYEGRYITPQIRNVVDETRLPWLGEVAESKVDGFER